jgi:hypothetical protein
MSEHPSEKIIGFARIIIYFENRFGIKFITGRKNSKVWKMNNSPALSTISFSGFNCCRIIHGQINL